MRTVNCYIFSPTSLTNTQSVHEYKVMHNSINRIDDNGNDSDVGGPPLDLYYMHHPRQK
jgi:hypothetical protein